MRRVHVRADPLPPVPLREVSGLAVAEDAAGALTLVAIGDREAVVAWASVEHGPDDLDWHTEDLSGLSGTRIPHRDPQLEAVAADGCGGVLLVQEWPNRAELVDAPSRRVTADLDLVVPPDGQWAPLHRAWQDPHGSHAEGVVLLRGGRLLVIAEKDPAALVEFGPAGAAPAGFGPGQWLPAGERWLPAQPTGAAATASDPAAGEGATATTGVVPAAGEGTVTLTALAAWYPDRELREACPDLSDATVGIYGNLAVLSDKGHAVALVAPHRPADEPGAGVATAVVVIDVAGLADKPEGLALLPNGDVLIACDRPKSQDNLFVIRRAAWRSLA